MTSGLSGVSNFSVYLPEARTVELAGTFTNWRKSAIALIREDTGWWRAEVPLAPGDYEFSYLVDGSVWLADYAATGMKRNCYGGWVSQLHVAVLAAAPVTATVHVEKRQQRAAA